MSLTNHTAAASTSENVERSPSIHDLDQLLDDLAVLAERLHSRDEFYGHLLNRSAEITNSALASLWILGPGHEPIRDQISDPALTGETRHGSAVDRRVTSVFGDRQARILPPDSQFPFAVIAMPVLLHGETYGILAFERRPGESPQVTSAYLRIVEALAEIAGEFEQKQFVSDHQQRIQEWQKLARLTLHAHARPDSRTVAYHLANDGREFLQCDRVSVVTAGTWRNKLVASSGVATVDSRSTFKKVMLPLVQRVMASRRPLVVHGQGEAITPRLRRWYDSYDREFHPQVCAIVPLVAQPNDEKGRKQSALLGALVAESFAPVDMGPFVRRLNGLTEVSHSALGNAARFEGIPLRPLWFALHRLLANFAPKRLIYTVALLVCLVGAAFFLFGTKTDFLVEVRGELRPVVERHVFAPADGLIQFVHVRHGNEVEIGDVLVEMRSPQLELQLEQINGEIETERERLKGISVIMNAANADEYGGRSERQLAADLLETQSRLKNQESQRAFIKNQIDQLTIRSPIDGAMVTWNIQQRLTARPVRRGESLLKIADTSGDWQMVFDVPDQKFGYISQAQQVAERPDLSVTAYLASDPETRYASRLNSFSLTSQNNTGQPSTVRATAPLTLSDARQFKPGTSVVGRVNCGRHTYFYVYTTEFVDAVRRRFFW